MNGRSAVQLQTTNNGWMSRGRSSSYTLPSQVGGLLLFGWPWVLEIDGVPLRVS